MLTLVSVPPAAWAVSPERGALDEYFKGLDIGKLTVDDILQLSRLLPDPVEQIDWLCDRAMQLDQLKLTAQSQQLAVRAAERLDAWLKVCRTTAGDDALEAMCAGFTDKKKADLRKRLDRLEGAHDWLEEADPNKLHKYFSGSEYQPPNNEAARLIFWARGDTKIRLPVEPAEKMSDNGPRFDASTHGFWLVPAGVSARVLYGDPPSELLGWEADLTQARRTFRQASQSNPAASRQFLQNVAADFRIGAALLGAALGADGLDRSSEDADEDVKFVNALVAELIDKKDGPVPVAQDNDPEFWRKLSEALDQRALWRLESQARVLQACALRSPPRADVNQAAPIADAALQRFAATVETVVGRTEPRDHLATALDQLAKRGRVLPTRGSLPLAFEFREQARKMRQEKLDTFKAKFGSGKTGNPDEALALMQDAKAAELGLQGSHDTVEGLKNKLGDLDNDRKPYPKIDLFVEFLDDGAGYYALCLGATTHALGSGDAWKVQLLGPLPPAEIIRAATGNAWLKKINAKILLAVDGRMRISREDLYGDDALLLDRIKNNEGRIEPGQGFLLVVPSGAALAPTSGWTLDRAVQLWYQSAVAAKTPGLGRTHFNLYRPTDYQATQNLVPCLDRFYVFRMMRGGALPQEYGDIDEVKTLLGSLRPAPKDDPSWLIPAAVPKGE